MPLARMTLGQIAGLHVGQVIEIRGRRAIAGASCRRAKKTLFVCEFGKLGQNYTVRVRHPFDAGAGHSWKGWLPAVRRQRREIGEDR